MPPGIGYGINPQIIMQALQKRGLLPNDRTSGIGQPSFVQPQGGMTPPQVSPLAGRQGSPQIRRKPGGISGFLNKPGISDMLMATGSALLAQSDQPGTSFAGALGRAIPVGAQALEYGQQKDEMRKQEEALDEAFKDAPPEMKRLLAGLPMAAKAQMAMQMLQPEEEADYTLSPGDVRYGSDDQPVAAVPDAPGAPPAVLQELAAWREANPDMAPAEQLRSFYEARRGPSVTVNNNEQSPADKALVGIEASDVEQAMSAANTARDQLGALRQVGRLLDEGVETGAMEERLLPVRQLATAFGVGDADQLIAQENFRALTNEIAIGMTQQLSGQISERELEFVRAAVPNLGTTPEANRRLVEIGTMANETAIAVAEAKREHFRENGTLAGFESKRKQIVQDMLLDNLPNADTSMVDDPETRLQELIQEGLSLEEIQAIARREGWAR